MATYEIGMNGSPYQELGDLDWSSLQSGDVVNVYWRPEPYTESILLNAQGTANNPILVQGIPGPDGELPILDSADAVTPEQLDHFNADFTYYQVLGGSFYIGVPGPSPDEIPEQIAFSGFGVSGASQENSVYEIGMNGSPYQQLGDIDWNSLQPGDTVNIHWQSAPYTERLLLNAQGTVDQPILIQGIPGPNGELPVLDSANATTPEQFANFNLDYRQELGGSIYIGPPQSYPSPDEIPTHITINGLEITGAGQGNSFTDTAGVAHSYGGSAGIYIKGGDNIIIENSSIHHNGMGIFSNSNHDFEITENLMIRGNVFDQNGLSGSYLRHHIYTEGINTTIDSNEFLEKIAGDQGSLVKMRDVGITISNNQFGSSPGHIIDLSDVQSDAMRAAGHGTSDAFYYDNVIIGNTIDASTGNIYLGGDSLGKENVSSETYRKSVDFRDNTVTYRADRDQLWRLGILRAPGAEQTFNIENNDFNASSATPGAIPTNFSLMADDGNLSVQAPNTVEGTIAQWADNASQNGAINGWQNVTIDGDSIDPDPIDPDPIDPDPVDPDPVDMVFGTSDDDTLFGGAEGEDIYGYQGNDTLYGASGDDSMYGGDGQDFVSGDGGDDAISGGDGNDYLDGSYGDDLVRGGLGDDRVSGGHGSDQLSGGPGQDKLLGGPGNDILTGGSGDDRLEGGSGDDILSGGSGLDRLFGGPGADHFVFQADTVFENIDEILDFSIAQGDQIDLTDLLNNFDPSTDSIDDFVSLEPSGWKHALLSVDVDGGGNNFQGVAIVGYGKDLDVDDIVSYQDMGWDMMF